MRTGTAATRASAEQAWAPVLTAAGPQGQDLGEQILAMAHTIATEPLSGPLTDPGREAEDKAALARDLFVGKVDDRVVALLQALARGRWSKPVDLISALHDLGIQSILSGARSEGTLDAVEQEIFAVAGALEDDGELRRAIEPSRTTQTEDRVRLAERAFGGSLSASAMSLVAWCVRHRADGGVSYNLRRVAERAADMQRRAIADVITATPMTSGQEERLRSILAARLGTDVELNTTVDPDVLGGVKVTMRDLVIDSTIGSAVDGLRASLTR